MTYVTYVMLVLLHEYVTHLLNAYELFWFSLEKLNVAYFIATINIQN